MLENVNNLRLTATSAWTTRLEGEALEKIPRNARNLRVLESYESMLKGICEVSRLLIALESGVDFLWGEDQLALDKSHCII